MQEEERQLSAVVVRTRSELERHSAELARAVGDKQRRDAAAARPALVATDGNGSRNQQPAAAASRVVLQQQQQQQQQQQPPPSQQRWVDPVEQPRPSGKTSFEKAKVSVLAQVAHLPP